MNSNCTRRTADILFAIALFTAMWLSSLFPVFATNSDVSLRVSAYDPFQHPEKAKLWSITTRDQQLIRAIERRINALPLVPDRDTYRCPRDSGDYYELTFRYNDGKTSVVKIENTGCRFVTFQDNKSPERWAYGADPLYRKLHAFRPKGGGEFGSVERETSDAQRGVAELGKQPTAGAHRQRGIYLNKLEQYEKAVDEFNKCLAIDPNSASTVYDDRGYAFEMLEQNEKAISDFTEAIKIQPKDTRAYCERAEAYLSSGKDQLATRDWQTIVDIMKGYDQKQPTKQKNR